MERKPPTDHGTAETLAFRDARRCAVIVRLARERSADRRSVLLRKLIARMVEEGSRKG